jgi:nucleoside-diphosphate-sugar epimerase
MDEYLVTGGAGFIGSHLVYALLDAGPAVRVLDDFSTGRRENLEPMHRPSRPGDIRTSCADIARARKAFAYEPAISVREGLIRTIEWHQIKED